MEFAAMATTALVVVGIVVVLAVIGHQVHEKRMEGKRQEALVYLLWATEKLYFYGRPVSECIRRGVIWELSHHDVGDFARPFGCLVLYGLHVHGDQTARVNWSQRYDEEAKREYYEVFVSFKYSGQYWRYDTQSRRLDGCGFRRMKENQADLNYACYDYWNVLKEERYFAGNCTDPKRSNLAPDFNYMGGSRTEIIEQVEQKLERVFLRP